LFLGFKKKTTWAIAYPSADSWPARLSPRLLGSPHPSAAALSSARPRSAHPPPQAQRETPPLSPPLALAQRILLPKPSASTSSSGTAASSGASPPRRILQQLHLLVLRDRTGELSHPPRQQASPVLLSSSERYASPLPLNGMLLLSIYPFGRFFFLQTYVLWSLRGSGRCLCAWTFLAAVADSPVFLTELTRFQSMTELTRFQSFF